MSRSLATLAWAGILTIGGLGHAPAQAQYGPGYRGFGGGSCVTSPGLVGGYGGGGYISGGYSRGYAGGGYSGYPGGGRGFGYNPNLPYSPAQQQGYREGQLYYETGIAPNRPLSPAEARGFVAGERRASATPWQLDPARQQGYREGQLYWETGIAPNRPLSPAEAQGFQAGERRAANGYYRPY
ncbi:hypothetical protein P12x_004888 [Tundrisphaera lichenicola]|uniref:hypothetical protein n=1 Tax=Tundrisphaera lichenicola TaxID=2029860 RepID=UPI003EB77D82